MSSTKTHSSPSGRNSIERIDIEDYLKVASDYKTNQVNKQKSAPFEYATERNPFELAK
jgi:hypothetical protein